MSKYKIIEDGQYVIVLNTNTGKEKRYDIRNFVQYQKYYKSETYFYPQYVQDKVSDIIDNLDKE